MPDRERTDETLVANPAESGTEQPVSQQGQLEDNWVIESTAISVANDSAPNANKAKESKIKLSVALPVACIIGLSIGAGGLAVLAYITHPFGMQGSKHQDIAKRLAVFIGIAFSVLTLLALDCFLINHLVKSNKEVQIPKIPAFASDEENAALAHAQTVRGVVINYGEAGESPSVDGGINNTDGHSYNEEEAGTSGLGQYITNQPGAQNNGSTQAIISERPEQRAASESLEELDVTNTAGPSAKKSDDKVVTSGHVDAIVLEFDHRQQEAVIIHGSAAPIQPAAIAQKLDQQPSKDEVIDSDEDQEPRLGSDEEAEEAASWWGLPYSSSEEYVGQVTLDVPATTTVEEINQGRQTIVADVHEPNRANMSEPSGAHETTRDSSTNKNILYNDDAAVISVNADSQAENAVPVVNLGGDEQYLNAASDDINSDATLTGNEQILSDNVNRDTDTMGQAPDSILLTTSADPEEVKAETPDMKEIELAVQELQETLQGLRAQMAEAEKIISEQNEQVAIATQQLYEILGISSSQGESKTESIQDLANQLKERLESQDALILEQKAQIEIATTLGCKTLHESEHRRSALEKTLQEVASKLCEAIGSGAKSYTWPEAALCANVLTMSTAVITEHNKLKESVKLVTNSLSAAHAETRAEGVVGTSLDSSSALSNDGVIQPTMH